MMKNLKLAFILFFALLAGCSNAPKIETITVTKIETVERCYYYHPFSASEWEMLYGWLENASDDYPPALVLEDYIRIRSMNECEGFE